LDLPGLDDLVTVHFTTWSRAGQLFGDSRDNGVPETLPTARMRPGLSEVVQRMHVGEQRRIWVPAHASVFVPDDDDDPPPRMADLTVDLELVALRKAPVQAALQPPAGASSTTSGLQYMFLKRGSDARVPELTDTILYKHSGWRANGRLVESSVLEGKGQTSVVFQMLPGLREGVRLMRVGDRAVFWVPANLAYGERPKRRVPRGPLVFELELLAIE
jgi:peptidylprolyl isomerase